jgi:hypothetical protein
MTPPIWLDAAGRRRPTLACWTCGREVAPRIFVRAAGSPAKRSRSRTGAGVRRSTCSCPWAATGGPSYRSGSPIELQTRGDGGSPRCPIGRATREPPPDAADRLVNRPDCTYPARDRRRARNRMTSTLKPTRNASPSPKAVLVAMTGWLRSSSAPGWGARVGFPGAGSIPGRSTEPAGGGADPGASGAGAGGGPFCVSTVPCAEARPTQTSGPAKETVRMRVSSVCNALRRDIRHLSKTTSPGYEHACPDISGRCARRASYATRAQRSPRLRLTAE